MKDLIAIGKIARAHGLNGEVLVVPFSRDLSPFHQLNHFYFSEERERRVEVLSVRNINNGFLLQFQGIVDRDTAERLVGKILEVERSDLPSLPEGTFFTYEFIGLQVKTDKGEDVGEILDILKLPAHDVYLVKKGEKEILIPAIDSVVKSVDLENRKMVISPMAGLMGE